jgi:hypothetical protein
MTTAAKAPQAKGPGLGMLPAPGGSARYWPFQGPSCLAACWLYLSKKELN